jgi:DNA-binding NarL/FixJ family response regulator
LKLFSFKLDRSAAGAGTAVAKLQPAMVANASPSVAAPIAGTPKDASSPASPAKMLLSERESRIIKMLAKGHPNKLIASEIDVTEATIKVHIKSIMRKLRVQNRTQAALWAVDHGYNAPAGSIQAATADQSHAD